FKLPEKISAADVAINYNSSEIGQLLRRLYLRVNRNQGELESFMMAHQTGFSQVALEKSMQEGYCPERMFPSESWQKMTRVNGKWEGTQSDLKSAMLEIYQLIKKAKTLTIHNLPFFYSFKNIETPESFLELIQNETIETFYFALRSKVCQFDRIKFTE